MIGQKAEMLEWFEAVYVKMFCTCLIYLVINFVYVERDGLNNLLRDTQTLNQ